MTNLRVLNNEIDMELEKKLKEGMWFRWNKDGEIINIWIKKEDVVGQILFYKKDEYFDEYSFTLMICTSRQIRVFQDENIYHIRLDFRGEGNDPRPEEILKLIDVYKNNPFVRITVPDTSEHGPLFAFSLYEEAFTGIENEFIREMKEIEEIAGIEDFTKDKFYAINTMLPYYEMVKNTLRKYEGGYKEFTKSLPEVIFRKS